MGIDPGFTFISLSYLIVIASFQILIIETKESFIKTVLLVGCQRFKEVNSKSQEHLDTMTKTCAEARAYLTQCNIQSLDRDKGGVPCEALCV